MAEKKNDPTAESTQAQAELAKAQAKADQAGAAALEESAKSLAETSSDAAFSTGEWASDPNPLGLRPAPGPTYLEYPGKAKEES